MNTPKIQSFAFTEGELRLTLSCGDAEEALGIVTAIDDALKASEVYVVRDAATKTVAAVTTKPTPAPGQEVVSTSTGAVLNSAAAEEIPAKAKDDKRPGLNPADALAAYDAMYNDAPKPAATAGTRHYSEGERYDGVEIVQVQESSRQGFGILTLKDGTRVKFDLATGQTLAVKNRPPLPEGASDRDLTIEPTTRQGGPGAPRVDQPLADSNGTPEGETPEWMQPIISAKGLKEAILLALERVPRDSVVQWALRTREQVPAFARVQESKLAARVERILSTIPEAA